MGKRNRRKGRRAKLKTTVQVTPRPRGAEQRPPEARPPAEVAPQASAAPELSTGDRSARGTEPSRATEPTRAAEPSRAAEPTRGAEPTPVLETDVTLDSQSNFYTGFTDDIGEGGVFVATEELLPVGTPLTLQFSLPDDRGPIQVDGEVRWVRQLYRSEHANGVGVAFCALSSAARSRIESFLAQRDALFYD